MTANLASNLHLDSFTFVYTAAAASGGVTAPWTDDFEDADISDWTILTAADASQGWILANGTNGSIVMYHADDNVSSGVDNYLASPVIDMSGLTSPLLSCCSPFLRTAATPTRQSLTQRQHANGKASHNDNMQNNKMARGRGGEQRIVKHVRRIRT